MEITLPIAVGASAFVGLVGLFFGWLAGHARNNNYTQAQMNYIEVLRDKIEALKTELKDSGEFFNHEISVLTKELDRRQHIIDAYKIGEQPNIKPIPQKFIIDWNPCNPVCDDFGCALNCRCENAVKSMNRQAEANRATNS